MLWRITEYIWLEVWLIMYSRCARLVIVHVTLMWDVHKKCGRNDTIATKVLSNLLTGIEQIVYPRPEPLYEPIGWPNAPLLDGALLRAKIARRRW